MELSTTRWLSLSVLGSALLTCCEVPELDPGPPAPTPVPQDASEFREVSGQIIDRAGQPVVGATIASFGYHPDAVEQLVVTDSSGHFVLGDLLDANSILQVTAPGFYSELIAVDLQSRESTLQLPPLALVRKQTGRVRLWLAGDTMFGRRFEDRDEDGNRNEEGDLIRTGSRAADTYELFRFIEPAMQSADYRVVNFESPASTAEASRHPFKQYSFTSHPETLDGLVRAGIDAVSLGNNHSYDYLDAGRTESEQAFRERGVAFFGSGASESDARSALLNVDINGLELSFQGYNGIKPSTYYPDPNQPWPHEFVYYATDVPQKGGALLLSSENVDEFLGKSPGRLKIPVMHGGAEYGTTPTGPMRDRFEQAHTGGAKLVVAHHSHTVYGVALWGDALDPSVSLLSLGNFIFDQDVFETFNSFMAVVDIDRANATDYSITQLRLIPFHQENYRPSLIAGDQAQWLARHVGHISTFLPDRSADTLRPAVAFADAAGIGVMLRPGDVRTTTASQVDVAVIRDGKSPLLALNQDRGPADYFTSYAQAPDGTRLRLAKDHLIFGDFEDHDVDAKFGENDHWWQTSTRYPTADEAHRGRYSMALYRARGSETSVNTQLRNRLSFDSSEELTLGCWFKGKNAGRVEVTAEYIRRGTRTQIGEERVFTLMGGQYDWTPWTVPLSPTRGAGHVRFVITMQPPEDKAGGTLFVDDCTLLSWGPTLSPGESVATPHGYGWARFEAPTDGPLSYLQTRTLYERANQ